MSTRAWGFTPRWYIGAPPALFASLFAFGVIGMGIMSGCSSKPAPTVHPTQTTNPTPQYPPRPTTPPTPFKLFHHDASSITLVVPDTATDTQLAALLWQLRDAAQSHTFDTLHLPQKLVDARDPYMWFHIYRGPKCAAEKYATGAPPCGGSYHAAADFTLGGFTDHDRTDSVLFGAPDRKEIHLWNPDSK